MASDERLARLLAEEHGYPGGGQSDQWRAGARLLIGGMPALDPAERRALARLDGEEGR